MSKASDKQEAEPGRDPAGKRPGSEEAGSGTRQERDPAGKRPGSEEAGSGTRQEEDPSPFDPVPLPSSGVMDEPGATTGATIESASRSRRTLDAALYSQQLQAARSQLNVLHRLLHARIAADARPDVVADIKSAHARLGELLDDLGNPLPPAGT